MLHLVLAELADAQVIHEPIAMWAFLAIGAIALFGIFLPVSVWVDARQKEREAYYKAETIRRVAEASGEGAKAAIDLLRENDRISQIRKLEGIGSSCMLGVMTHGGLLSTVGLIPGLIGVALLVYVFFLAEPV
jgi:hypothetical protein